VTHLEMEDGDPQASRMTSYRVRIIQFRWKRSGKNLTSSVKRTSQLTAAYRSMYDTHGGTFRAE